MSSSILTFPQYEKTSVGVRESSTSHELEGIGQGEEGLLISGYGVWTDTAKN
jgi:hypothetical protein